MTLSQFLRDYLYIPLGGNRHGPAARYVNLMITMVLGGLWHGAAWTFVVWGVLHGLYLCVNHAWNRFGPSVAPRFARAADVAGFILTFLAVVVAWVFFRADNLPAAIDVLSRMADPSRIAFGRLEIAQAVFIAIHAAIAWFGPNTQAVMGYDHANRKVGEGLSGWKMRPRFILCNRCRAGVRNSRNPAAQRIHLFQVLMGNPGKSLPRFLSAVALVILSAVALNYVVDPLQLFRPGSRFRCDVFVGQPLAGRRTDPQPAVRRRLHGHLACASLPPERYRPASRRPLAEADDDGFQFQEQGFVLAAALERHPGRVIWQMDDWIFRDAPEIDADRSFPADLYRRNARGIASYLFGGAMARESLWILARSIAPLRPLVARLTNGVMFTFSIPDVDDINVLRPDFDVAENLQRRARDGRLRAPHRPRTQPPPHRGL